MQTAAASLPHSGMGIASLILSIAATLSLLVVATIASVAQTRPGGLDENSPAAIVLGLVAVLLGMAQLLALGLGIAGLVQPGRNKTFGIIGTVFSCVYLLGTGLLMLVGAVLE